MSSNIAAYLPTKQARPFTVGEQPTPQPNAHEVLIRVRAVAINPVDAGIQAMGFLWENYPLTLGSDVAGEVVAIGADVQTFQPGDRVIACVEQGGFGTFCVADTAVTAKLPDNVTFVEGSTLPLGLTTAMMGCFHPESLELDLPTLEPKANGKVVVVWGASSSVGSCALQMVKAAGYEVVVTASPHNTQYCKDLGASKVLDHRTDTAVEDIITAVEQSGKRFAGVYCAIITPDVIKKCAVVADRLGTDERSRTVATVMAPGMPFDETLPDGIKLDYCAGLADIVPETKLKYALGYGEVRPNSVGPAIWGQWLTAALEKGIMKCKPEAEVVGRGLEKVQEACDRMAAGVSAKKLVVELP